MKFVLPVSEKEVLLQSLSRKVMKELQKKEVESMREVEKHDADVDVYFASIAARENAVMALYPEYCFDEMPNRDVEQLIAATYRYSKGEPEEEIKNLLSGTSGSVTKHAATTATTAAN